MGGHTDDDGHGCLLFGLRGVDREERVGFLKKTILKWP